METQSNLSLPALAPPGNLPEPTLQNRSETWTTPLPRKIRVGLADDSSVFRRVLVTALEQCADIEVLWSATSGKELLKFLVEREVDVVLLDVEMQGFSGTETVAELRTRNHFVPVILLASTGARGHQEATNALVAGANDVVIKPLQVGQVSKVVQELAHGLPPKIRDCFQQIKVARNTMHIF